MAPDANQQSPNAAPPGEDQVYFPGTETPRRRLSNAEITAADKVSAPGPEPQQQPANAETPADSQVDPIGPKVEPVQPPLPDQPPKAGINPTYIYAGIGVGLGVLVALVVGASLLQGNRGSATGDFPAVASGSDGLQGHLLTKWDERPEYRLTIGPSSPQQLGGFSMAVGHSTRPISFDIQLKDPMGFVLCGKTIVVKFDPIQPADPAAAAPSSATAKNGADQAVRDQEVKAIETTQLQAAELEREVGKDIFQNDVGQNGQIESITSQGALPCAKKEYESAVAWSFSSNFPTLAEQAGLLNPQSAIPATETPSPLAPSPVRRAVKRKAVEPLPIFYIEGDDSIVGYDASTGAVEAAAGRTYFIDKAGLEANTLKGRDLPIEIHYRCDQTGLCTLAGRNGLTLHARLRK